MGDLLVLGIAFGAGLMVGWNVLPQPIWARMIFSTLKSNVKD